MMFLSGIYQVFGDLVPSNSLGILFVDINWIETSLEGFRKRDQDAMFSHTLNNSKVTHYWLPVFMTFKFCMCLCGDYHLPKCDFRRCLVPILI